MVPSRSGAADKEITSLVKLQQGKRKQHENPIWIPSLVISQPMGKQTVVGVRREKSLDYRDCTIIESQNGWG